MDSLKLFTLLLRNQFFFMMSYYLGQLVPELIQVAKNLGMDLRAPDVVYIP